MLSGAPGGVKDGVVDCAGVLAELKLKGTAGVAKLAKPGVPKGVRTLAPEDVTFLKIFFVGVGGGKSSWDPARSSPSRLNKLDFLICPARTCWKNKLPLVGGALVEAPNGVVGLPTDFRDCRRPALRLGGYVAELYCFLQGVSGIMLTFAPRCFGGPSSGLRFILDTKPVDMKAAWNGLACL